MKNLPIQLQLYQYNSGDVSSRQAPGFGNVAHITYILAAQTADQLTTFAEENAVSGYGYLFKWIRQMLIFVI